MARLKLTDRKNYNTGTQTIITWTSAAGVTPTSGRGTASIDTTFVATQASSLKIQNTTGGTLNCDFVCVLGASYDATGSPYVQICFYNADPLVSNGGDGLKSLQVLFGSGDLTATNRATIFFGSNTSGVEVRTGWNVISVPRHEASSVGATFDWSNITHIQFATNVSTYHTGTDGGPIYIDSIILGAKTRPKIIIGFDDGYDSVHDTAYPIMAARGFAGVAYLGRDYGIDTAGFMTTANLNTLYAAGWDIGNHCLDSTGLDATASNIASVVASMETNRDWLISSGWPRAADHVAYVGGQFYPDADISDTTFINAVAAAGMKSGRTIDDRRRNSYGALPSTGGMVEGWHRLFSHSIANAVTTAAVLARIKDAVDRGHNYIMTYHKVEAVGGSITRSTADFTTDMDNLKIYVDAGLVDVVTVSEFYNGMSGKDRLTTSSRQFS